MPHSALSPSLVLVLYVWSVLAPGKLSDISRQSTKQKPLSVSVYESKSPVRRLGHRNVVGFTKSIRTIAGSMILTVVEEHPLQQLAKTFNSENVFSLDEDLGYVLTNSSPSPSSWPGGQSIATRMRTDNRLSTILPEFDLSLYYKSETDKDVYAKSKIVGIEFINESIVTSVNDMVTEISLQFVAKDFMEFTGYGSRRPVASLVPQTETESENAVAITTISDRDGITNSELNRSTDNNILRYLNGTTERLG